MNNHTPEPWRVQLTQIQTGCNATTYEVVTDEYDVVSAARGIRKEADAKLIAAAPDLLKAVSGLLDIISDSYGVAGFHLNGEVARWNEFGEVTEAKKALIKAGYDSPEVLK